VYLLECGHGADESHSSLQNVLDRRLKRTRGSQVVENDVERKLREHLTNLFSLCVQLAVVPPHHSHVIRAQFDGERGNAEEPTEAAESAERE
ncbi:hypothetical protein PFISCL1PPCAC_18342, partial [Pristionchus fissidentatus]